MNRLNSVHFHSRRVSTFLSCVSNPFTIGRQYEKRDSHTIKHEKVLGERVYSVTHLSNKTDRGKFLSLLAQSFVSIRGRGLTWTAGGVGARGEPAISSYRRRKYPRRPERIKEKH
jgi:hypothetical protein